SGLQTDVQKILVRRYSGKFREDMCEMIRGHPDRFRNSTQGMFAAERRLKYPPCCVDPARVPANLLQRVPTSRVGDEGFREYLSGQQIDLQILAKCASNLLFHPEEEILCSVRNQDHWLDLRLTSDRTHLLHQVFVKSKR